MYPHVNTDEFVRDWINAWNSREIEVILSHYAEDVEFTSPFVVRLLNQPDGTLHGLTDLRSYFLKGLETYPDLRFELIEVLEGVNSVTLYYHSVKNLMSAEVMVLDEKGKISKVLAHYSE
jgi:predicted ester cyclase